MALVPLFLFLITLYVRPQDWVPGFIGFPTALILIPLCLMVGGVNLMKEPEKFRTPQAWLLPVYLAIMYLATLANVDIGRENTATTFLNDKALSVTACLLKNEPTSLSKLLD